MLPVFPQSGGRTRASVEQRGSSAPLRQSREAARWGWTAKGVNGEGLLGWRLALGALFSSSALASVCARLWAGEGRLRPWRDMPSFASLFSLLGAGASLMPACSVSLSGPHMLTQCGSEGVFEG